MEKQILTQLDKVKEWFGEIEQYTSVVPSLYSFDWETTGLNYLTMESVGVSFCDGERACYIDLWENPDEEAILTFLGHVFSSGTFIAHNAKFDIKCSRRFTGIDPYNVFCTYIASYLLDENRPSHALKILTVQDLYTPLGEVQGWEKAKEYGYHSKEWYKYCFNDAVWAFQLYKIYEEELTEQGLDHVFYDIEMPFLYVIADMEINGIKVDIDTLNKLEFKTKNKLIELEDRMAEMANIKITIQNRMFDLPPERIMAKNLRSPEQLKKILKTFGITIKDTKKETLKKLKGKHEFVDLLLDYKKLRKLYDAYIVPAFSLVDTDGRIHPSFGIVKTGRTNCRTPNLQQLPNLSKSYPDLDYRSIFIGENGYKLIGGDYSGQELRCLGEVSHDITIIDSFRSGFDLHLVTANFIFNLELGKDSLRDGTDEHKLATTKYKSERYKAKNGVNFPIVFGSSEYGISHHMNVPVETAKEWRKKFFELYPGVKQAIEDTRIELQENLYVTTMMGRRRRFPDYKILPNYSKGKTPSKSRAVRQAFNFKIQGFSADQIKIAAILSRKAGLKILLIIHDEIVCESRNPQQDVRTLKLCMEQAVKLSIPYIANVKIGDRYSELKE